MIQCSETILPRGGQPMRLCYKPGWWPTAEGGKCRAHFLKWQQRQENQRLAAAEKLEPRMRNNPFPGMFYREARASVALDGETQSVPESSSYTQCQHDLEDGRY